MNLQRLNPLRGIRRLQRIVAALKRIPELETKVEQVMVAYQKDARFAERLPTFQAKANGTRVFKHVLDAARRAPVLTDPCPHTVFENLVPDELYDELLSALPAPVFFKHERTREEMQVPFVLAPAYSRVVWDFFFAHGVERGLVTGLTDTFTTALDELLSRYWPSLGTWRESGLQLRVTNSRLLLRRPGYVIKPHRDPRWHFITCLIYLQKRHGGDACGTQLYRLRHDREPSHNSPFRFEPEECELARDVPARHNTVLAFFNSTGAHGASIPVDAPATLERYVYQVQFGPDHATREKLVAMLKDTDRQGWTMKDAGY